MLHKFGFELNRLFRSKLTVFLIIITIVSLTYYSLNSGIKQYKDAIQQKEVFLKYEKDVLSRIVNYSQYGDLGFRVTFFASPLSIFFNQTSIFDNLHSNVDMSEIIEIYIEAKGKKIFKNRSHIRDFSGTLYLFGSLLWILLGAFSLKGEKRFYRFENAIFRLIILVVCAALYLFAVFNIPKLFGFQLFDNDTLLYFGGYAIAFLCFFYAAGLFVRTLVKSRVIKIVIVLAFWFLSVEVVPFDIFSSYLDKQSNILQHNEIYNSKKIKELLAFEKEVKKAVKGINSIKERDAIYEKMAIQFFGTGYKENVKIEIEISDNVKKIVDDFENKSSYYPPCFFLYLCGEFSSKGYQGYLSFAEYILNLRHEFVKFILLKRYRTRDKEIELFVNNSENVFSVKNQIPKAYSKGTGLTTTYTILLLLASFLILKWRRNQKKETLKPTFIQDDGRMYYLLCQNDKYMNMIYHYYENQSNTLCIDNINGKDIDPGISLPKMTGYFCKLTGANKDRTFEHLEKLGISNLENEKRTPETIKKIYCAVSLAVECDTFVLKNFISRESRTFERKFLALLKYIMEQDTTIIYLGTEPLQTNSKLKNVPAKVDKYQDLKIDDPLAFILR